MKIYLCGRYSRRDELRSVREELVRLGHAVTSRWLDTNWEEKERQDQVYSSAAPPEYREQYAVADLEDVRAADCLIAFTEEPRSGGRGGRHVEYGAALALGKRLLVVGHRENLFHHHPKVEFFEALSDLICALWDPEQQAAQAEPLAPLPPPTSGIQPDPSHDWKQTAGSRVMRCVRCGAYRHLGSGFMPCPSAEAGQ